MSPATFLRRLSVLAGMVGIAGASLSGCGGGGSSSTSTGTPGSFNNAFYTAPDISTRAVCQANTHVSGHARWTLLVYMNAANDLQPDSLINVAQMASAGSDSNINIVLQWKQATCPGATAQAYGGCGTPSFIGTRRYFLHQHSASDVSAIQGGNTTVLDADRLADPTTNDSTGQSDMGSYLTLANFAQWGTQNYPADNMALLIWDHGAGWENALRSVGKTKAAQVKLVPGVRSFSQDYSTLDEIETWELNQALTGLSQPLDMLIFDASLEQMLEIEFQARTLAKVMVGSEESPPGPGYPYDQFINGIKASGKNPCDAGQTIVQTFISNYANNSTYSTDITQSVIDLTRVSATATALQAFGTSLLTHKSDQATLLATARNTAQQYAYTWNKDLYNYADIIRKGTTAPDLQQAAAGVENSLIGANTAVLITGHGAQAQANSNGVAVYVPDPGTYISTYPNLQLVQQAAPAWNQWIQAQVQ